MRRIDELAAEALRVQNTSNINIVHGFSRALTDLRALLPEASSDEVNTHPIMQLWASKVHDLAGMGMSDEKSYGKAYKACEALSQG